MLLDLWESRPPGAGEFTTVGNWQQAGLDLVFRGEPYLWSKHHEFLKFLDLPRRVNGQPIELATNLGETLDPERREVVAAVSVETDARSLLTSHGWRLADASGFTTDPFRYRDYIAASRGEFTVARDLNVRLRSGWFSERSACYLAAGRPVITQDTGFGTVLPTGKGLFAFNTMDDILAAFDAINSDYAATAGRRGRSPRSTSGPKPCWPSCSTTWGSEPRDNDMKTDRFLIINADDFGISRGVNRGIVRAFEQGVVTSASLMVRWPAAAEAARYGRQNPTSASASTSTSVSGLSEGRWVQLYGSCPWTNRAPSARSASVSSTASASWSAATPTISTRISTSTARGRPRKPRRTGFRAERPASARPARGPLLRRVLRPERRAGRPLSRGHLGRDPHEADRRHPPRGHANRLPPRRRRRTRHDVSSRRVLEVRTLCDPLVREVVRGSGITLLTFRDVTPSGGLKPRTAPPRDLEPDRSR